MSRKQMTIALHVLAASVLLWNAALYLQEATDTVWNYLFNIAYGALWATGGVLGLAQARKLGLRSIVGRGTALFSVALLANALGQVIWTYYNLADGIEIPGATLADFAWYVSYPLIAAGTVLLLRANPVKVDPWRAVVSLLVPFAVLTFVLGAFAPYLRDAAPDELTVTVVNTLYLVFDSITIGLSFLALAVYGGRLGVLLLVFLIGTFIRSTANLLFLWRTEHDVYWNGDVADTLFAVSAYVQAYALIAVSPSLPGPAAAPPPSGGSAVPARNA